MKRLSEKDSESDQEWEESFQDEEFNDLNLVM